MSGAWIPNPAPFPSTPPDRWPAPATPPSAPLPQPGPGRGRGAAAAIVAAAMVFAVLVAGALGWAARRDEDRSETAASTSAPGPTTTPFTFPSPSPSPSTRVPPSSTIPPRSTVPPSTRVPPSTEGPPSTPAPPPGRSQTLAEALPDLIAFVERERGHRFRTRPRVEAIDASAFDAKLRADLERRRGELAKEQVSLRALGQLKPDADLVEVYRGLLEAGVVGFYDPESKELFVQGTTVTAYRRTVIVHELTHALDDQHFDLNRLSRFEGRPDESGFGFLSIVEGSAKRVENAYRRSLSARDRAALAAEEAQLASGVNPFQFPIAVQVRQALPYLSGERLAEALVDAGGIAGLDRAFGHPPTTSEQVLDPAAFRAGEAARAVPAPKADGAVVDAGAFGLVDLQLTLLGTDPLGALDAFEPLEGWGGGRFVAWRGAGGQSCARVHLVGDRPADTEALGDQLSGWASRSGAEVRRVGWVLEVTRCA